MKSKIILCAFFTSTLLCAATKIKSTTTTVTNNQEPIDIYNDYYAAKKVWSGQQVAKAELSQFVNANKTAVASKLQLSEDLIQADGPQVSEDGNVCVNYSAERSKLGSNIKNISPKLQALAREITEKNDSPISGSNVTAAHYSRTLEDSNMEKVELLTTCLSPDKF